MVQWLGLCLPLQGVSVRSLVGDASPPKNPQSIKQKQYCTKFNGDFENGPHQKKKKILKKMKLPYGVLIKYISENIVLMVKQ